MTLCRAVFLFVFAAASTCAFAADPNSPSVASPNTSFQLSRTTGDTGQSVPWFTGTKRLDSQMKLGRSTYAVRREASNSSRIPSENYCLKLRTYKVKGQERFGQ